MKELHGMSKEPIYSAWSQMRSRCDLETHKDYKYYGGRGIKVCEEWSIFTNFYRDMGDKPSDSHSLDRIDNNSNYTPDNCIWTTHTNQMLNRRAYGKLGLKHITKNINRFRVQINRKGINKYWGLYDTLDDAITARDNILLKYYERGQTYDTRTSV